MFPEDKHLETYLVPNKKPEPSAPNLTVVQFFQVTAISFSVSVALSFTLFDKLLDLSPQVNVQLPDRWPSVEEDNNNQPSPVAPKDPAEQTVHDTQRYYLPIEYESIRQVLITNMCNGTVTGGANFRISPSLNAAAILGVVLAGDPVQLTGHTVFADGVFWYEARNELPLAVSSEPQSSNQLDSHQVGWVADCFVKG